jgi:alkanesulfonate monooxygenase SsuD/methylene tetrahydromethanopterin reductase-like flavin-dependent oxidoreductase (luciferase family)
VGPQRTERLIQIYRDAIRAAVPVGKFVNNQVTGNTVAYCAEDRRKAVERGAELIDWYRHQQRLRDAIVWQGYEISKLPDTYRWHYQRTLADAARQDDTSSLGLIQQGGRFCIGDPDDCLRYLEMYEAMGLDEIMPLFQVGSISHGEVMETLRLFGKYIIPHFQGKAQGSVG